MTLSRSIDEEGIRVEPSYLQRAGKVQNDVLDRILRAVRTPDERLGDLDAQLAANSAGAAALERIIAGHGLEMIHEYGRALLDYSQSFLARSIQAIPDGEYRFDDVMDDDGTGYGPVGIRAVVRIHAEHAVVDLSGCDDQVSGCINCPSAVARAAVYYCFACLLDGHVPLNGGCFRNIEVITRPGSVVHAQYPAAVVAGNTELSQRIVDVVFGALRKALPERIPAASCGTMSSVALGSSSGNERATWTYYETIGGGSGASPVAAGASAVQCHMTNTLNTPAEAIEMQYPLRVRRFERARDTGGDGAHRGGDGIVRELEVLAPAEGTVIADRRVSRPYGAAGGEPGRAGQNAILRSGGEVIAIPGKSHLKLARGDVLRIVTPGGGGWGEARDK